MIGVIANPADQDVIREFFELFKTPWEFYRSDRRYDVLLSTGDTSFHGTNAMLLLIYAGKKIPFDAEEKIQIESQRSNSCILLYKGTRIPIYGGSITFWDQGSGILTDEDSQQPAVYLKQTGGKVLARIGYDLFGEIRTLLTVGQPPANASLPA